jgi:ABC-type glycerol-3-phosphate transport system substrate-binding protein
MHSSVFSLRNILLGVGLFATLFAVLIFSGKISIGGKDVTAQGEVQLWGTLPESEMNAVVQSFNPQAKTYAVRYTYVPENEFNQRLLEALASGTGPDMIIGKYQMILSQEARIYPFPTNSLPEKTFKDTFVDGASVLFTPQGALALPVSIDPMVLFYNRTLLSKHGIINPPSYWDEVGTITPALTVRQNGKFLESAIALGTPGVPYAKDIIMSIIAQLGQAPVVRIMAQGGESYFSVVANTPATEGGEILPLATTNRFFTQFGDPGQTTFTWSDSLGNATDFFVGEKLAMYIGYAGEYPTLRARNPRADFGMTSLPQTRGYNTLVTGMSMYAIATLKASKNLTTALTAESQFAGAGVAPSIAAIVGATPALRSYAATQGLDPVVARGMLVAHGWYDSHERESTAYTTTMISDIINYRYGVNDASNLFVARMRDLYSKK